MGRQEEFKKLEKNQMNKLSNLVSEDGNMLWLRIQFSLPEELKGKDIGLYIGHLRSASMLFMNNNGIRKYGEFPPIENTAGYTTQYFMFPNQIVSGGLTGIAMILNRFCINLPYFWFLSSFRFVRRRGSAFLSRFIQIYYTRNTN